MAKRAQGIDIRPQYQPVYNYQAHHDFAMVQVTDGIYENGGLKGALYANLRRVPVLLGYHYARSAWSAEMQVEAFLNTIDRRNYKFDGFMVDFEQGNNVRGESYCIITKGIMDELRKEKRTTLYSGRYVIQDWMYKFGHYWLRDHPEDYPLMIAQYPYDHNKVKFDETWADKIKDLDRWYPVLPAGITEWEFWQYSADGNKQGPANGIPKPNFWTYPSVDLDVFNGTVQELMALYTDDQDPGPQPPQPAPDNCEEEIRKGQIKILDQAQGRVGVAVSEAIKGLKKKIEESE